MEVNSEFKALICLYKRETPRLCTLCGAFLLQRLPYWIWTLRVPFDTLKSSLEVATYMPAKYFNKLFSISGTWEYPLGPPGSSL